MTHKDIYTKFMIEYDKANVTSSYPSLTEYEVATLLDKAYLALIAQKFTGNNIRRSAFEGDAKVISDLAPLVRHMDLNLSDNRHAPAINVTQFELPSDFMYYVSSALNWNDGGNNPYDKHHDRLVPMKLVDHDTARKFYCTPYNMPWVKVPVCYVEGDDIYAVYDPINKPIVDGALKAHLSYIGYPMSFVSLLVDIEISEPDIEIPDTPDVPDTPQPQVDDFGYFILAESMLAGVNPLAPSAYISTPEGGYSAREFQLNRSSLDKAYILL